MITFDVFTPGKGLSDSAAALDRQLVNEDPDMTYSQMMRFRLSGQAASECTDTYFIATQAGRYVARLWHGWGKHVNSIGNFGNFKTLESFQRQGIGRKLLAMWHNDLTGRPDIPLALFCTSSQPHLVRLYGEYGFRPALCCAEGGPLYSPLGNSPDSFQEFCARYYSPAESLILRPASIGWRHEIDCLLKFYLLDHQRNASLPGAVNLEYALLHPEAGKAELFFTDAGYCVGWAFTPAGGVRYCCLHPDYQGLPVRGGKLPGERKDDLP